jgi:hypothetical protein
MNAQVKEYLEDTQIEQAQEYKNLVVVPIISQYEDGANYLLLDEALEQESLRITEVDKDGSVPDLKVANGSDQMILIFDGEELVGAKQNRIVNTTILLAPKSETLIPVSCVEQGRWSHRSERFHSEKRMSPSAMRRNKSEQVMYSMRMSRGFRSDQGEIWSEIRERQSRRAAPSPTGEMSELYRKDRPLLDEYKEKFESVEKQVGALFVINGKVVGLDSYGNSDILSKVFPKLIESYAIDALDMYKEKTIRKAKDEATNSFVEQCLEIDSEEHPSVSLGTDCRLSSNKQVGSALVYNNRVMHLSVFAKETSQSRSNNSRTRFSRMSQRRRHHSE